MEDNSRIKVGNRLRKDPGDIESLAKSIADIGLLHPIVVSQDGFLIAGLRRLEAWRSLGRPDSEIPKREIPLKEIGKGEFAENTERKDFTISEAWAIYQALKPVEESTAKERQGARTDLQLGANFAPSWVGRSRSRAAAFTGYSHTTLNRAGEMVLAANVNEKYRTFVEEMDSSGNVSGAYRKFLQQRLLDEEELLARRAKSRGAIGADLRIILGDSLHMSELADESVDLVVADPPMNLGVFYGDNVDDNMNPDRYGDWIRRSVKECLRVLKIGGQLFMFMPIKWMPWWMPEIRDLWEENRGHLLPWCKTMAHLHYEKTWIRAWEPVLWIPKGGSPAVFHRSYRFDDDKDWFIGTNGIAEVERLHMLKLHPTPRPTWIYKYFILLASDPGMLVLDPFLGSGTGAWAAKTLGRRFVGYEIVERFVQLSERRVSQEMLAPEKVGLSDFRQAQLISRWEADGSKGVDHP